MDRQREVSNIQQLAIGPVEGTLQEEMIPGGGASGITKQYI